MHRPERWGYVQFSTAMPGTAAFVPGGAAVVHLAVEAASPPFPTALGALFLVAVAASGLALAWLARRRRDEDDDQPPSGDGSSAGPPT